MQKVFVLALLCTSQVIADKKRPTLAHSRSALLEAPEFSTKPLLHARGVGVPPAAEAARSLPAAEAAHALRGGSGGVSLTGASPFVLKCASFAALDALLLGYDIGVISGTLFFIAEQFGLTTHDKEVFASALNSAAILGSLLSGLIADRFGRKPALFLSSLAFTIGSCGMALAPTFRQLMAFRYVQGFGVGAGLLISPMFISEIAPPAFRGSLVTLAEVSLSIGILLAYVANVALSKVEHQWRWMLALAAFPSVLLTLRILFLPESPRYLVGKGDTARARSVLRRILSQPKPHGPRDEALSVEEREASAKAVEAAEAAEEAETEAVLADIVARAKLESRSSWQTFKQPAVLCAVVIGSVLAFLQHAVGIESIIYYSPHVFKQAGVASQRAAMVGTVSMGLIKLIFESYALLNVDRIGRRPLLLVGSAGLAVSLFALGAALGLKSGEGVTGASFVVFGSLAAYMAFHALSFGPITWLVLSEIFPSSVRGKAMGIATTINRATSFVVSLTFLSLCERLNWSGAFYLYAGWAVFALVFYAVFVPETTGLPLEAIAPKFEHPREIVRTNLASLGLAKAPREEDGSMEEGA